MAKGLPLALALLTLTATLSGCLGDEEATEPVDISLYTDQIDANNVTISQLLANISEYEATYQASQAQVKALQVEIVNLSSALAMANENISTMTSLQAQLDDAFSELAEANAQISFLQIQWSNANQTIAQLASGWSGANSTITSLVSTYSAATLFDTVPLNYSEHCLGAANQMNSGLDNGDGEGTPADGQLHNDEIDERYIACQRVMFIKNIFSGSGSSNPAYLTALGNTLFFRASDEIHGDELWKSDGTANGTMMVKDINNGSNGSSLFGITVVGNTLFFNANDGTNGSELWKSDGTPNGTVMVKDINSGSDGSSSSEFTAVGNTLYFRAYDGTHGAELWKSDGTANGTVMVKDIYDGSGNSYPTELTAIGNTLFFQAIGSSDFSGETYGREVWVSDGTESGTWRVTDINSGSGDSFPSDFVAIGNTVYFIASREGSGNLLWKANASDGWYYTNACFDCTSVSALTAVGNTLYFQASDGTNGAELWKSDGTESGTMMVKDINSGSGSSSPTFFTAVGNTLFFSIGYGNNLGGLWKSDGTANGTTFVADFYDGYWTGIPFDLLATGDTLYFQTRTSNQYYLWKHDPSVDVTVKLMTLDDDTPSNSYEMTTIGNKLYFAAVHPTDGRELWMYSL